MSSQTLSIPGSMGALNAILQLPRQPQCRMCVFCHGFAGNLDYHLWQPMARLLNDAGIGVLRFDFGGCGQSGGKFADMTILSEIDDLYSVIAHVRALPGTRGISLVGHSQGGVVCAMAAGRLGARQIDALVLMSAAAVLRDDALRGTVMGLSVDPWHLDQPGYKLPSGLELGREYIRTAMDLPIYETAAAYAGPALVLNGMADQIVPYTYAQRFHDVLAASDLALIPGENHPCTNNPQYVVDLAVQWLLRHLSPTE